MSQSEQNELDKYLEAKAKEAKHEEDNAQAQAPLSAYEACVLKESARVRALMEEAREKNEEEDLKNRK